MSKTSNIDNQDDNQNKKENEYGRSEQYSEQSTSGQETTSEQSTPEEPKNPEKEETKENNDSEKKNSNHTSFENYKDREYEEDNSILNEEDKAKLKKIWEKIKGFSLQNSLLGTAFLGILNLATKAIGIIIQNVLLGERVQQTLEKTAEKEANKASAKEEKKDGKETQKEDTKDDKKEEKDGKNTDTKTQNEDEKKEPPSKEVILDLVKETIWNNDKEHMPEFAAGRVYFHKLLTKDNPELQKDPNQKPSAKCCWVSELDLVKNPGKTASAMYHSGYITDPDKDLMKVKTAFAAMKIRAIVYSELQKEKGVLAEMSFSTEKYGKLHLAIDSKEEGKIDIKINGKTIYENLPADLLKSDKFSQVFREGLETKLSGIIKRNAEKEIKLDDLVIKKEGKDIKIKLGGRTEKTVKMDEKNLPEKIEKVLLSQYKTKDRSPESIVCHINGTPIRAKTAALAIASIYTDKQNLNINRQSFEWIDKESSPLFECSTDKRPSKIASQTHLSVDEVKKALEFCKEEKSVLITQIYDKNTKTDTKVAVTVENEMLKVKSIDDLTIPEAYILDINNITNAEEKYLQQNGDCIFIDDNDLARRGSFVGNEIVYSNNLFSEPHFYSETQKITVPDLVTSSSLEMKTYFDKIAEVEHTWDPNINMQHDIPKDEIPEWKEIKSERDYSDPFITYEEDKSGSFRGDDDIIPILDDDTIVYRETTDSYEEVHINNPKPLDEEIPIDLEI